MDGNKLTWVDDVTATSAANFNRMEGLLQDAVQDSKQRGSTMWGQRPAASPATKNWLWMDSDTGSMYYCDGGAWYEIGRQPLLADYVADAPWTITNPPSTADGLNLSYNNIVLLTAQANARENGLWQWQGAGAALSRPPSMLSRSYVPNGAEVTVYQGVRYGGSKWQQVSPGGLPSAGSAGVSQVDISSQTWVRRNAPAGVFLDFTAGQTNDYTLLGLHGQTDKGYDIEFAGRFISGAANKYVLLRPLNDQRASYAGVDHYTYNDTNGALQHALEATPIANPSGMILFMGDWNMNGSLVGRARFYAEGLAGNQGRPMVSDYVFRPDTATDARTMHRQHQYYWHAQAAPGGVASPYTDTTEVTSLAITFGGGTFYGHIRIKRFID